MMQDGATPNKRKSDELVLTDPKRLKEGAPALNFNEFKVQFDAFNRGETHTVDFPPTLEFFRLQAAPGPDEGITGLMLIVETFIHPEYIQKEQAIKTAWEGHIKKIFALKIAGFTASEDHLIKKIQSRIEFIRTITVFTEGVNKGKSPISISNENNRHQHKKMLFKKKKILFSDLKVIVDCVDPNNTKTLLEIIIQNDQLEPSWFLENTNLTINKLLEPICTKTYYGPKSYMGLILSGPFNIRAYKESVVALLNELLEKDIVKFNDLNLRLNDAPSPDNKLFWVYVDFKFFDTLYEKFQNNFQINTITHIETDGPYKGKSILWWVCRKIWERREFYAFHSLYRKFQNIIVARDWQGSAEGLSILWNIVYGAHSFNYNVKILNEIIDRWAEAFTQEELDAIPNHDSKLTIRSMLSPENLDKIRQAINSPARLALLSEVREASANNTSSDPFEALARAGMISLQNPTFYQLRTTVEINAKGEKIPLLQKLIKEQRFLANMILLQENLTLAELFTVISTTPYQSILTILISNNTDPIISTILEQLTSHTIIEDLTDELRCHNFTFHLGLLSRHCPALYTKILKQWGPHFTLNDLTSIGEFRNDFKTSLFVIITFSLAKLIPNDTSIIQPILDKWMTKIPPEHWRVQHSSETLQNLSVLYAFIDEVRRQNLAKDYLLTLITHCPQIFNETELLNRPIYYGILCNSIPDILDNLIPEWRALLLAHSADAPLSADDILKEMADNVAAAEAAKGSTPAAAPAGQPSPSPASGASDAAEENPHSATTAAAPRAGIASKYLGIKKSRLPEAPTEGAPAKSFNQRIKLVPLSALEAPLPSAERTSLFMQTPHFSWEYYYSGSPPQAGNEQMWFICAGRKLNALVVQPQNGRCVLVLTEAEYQSFKANLSHAVDVLVIKKLASPTHGHYADLSLITSRRLAILLFAYHYNLDNIMMLDDNIREIRFQTDNLAGDEYAQLWQQISIQAQDYACVSIRALNSKAPVSGELGSKFFKLNLTTIKAKLTDYNQLFLLFPEATQARAWGEDYTMQIMLHLMLDKQKSYHILNPQQFCLIRSRKYRNAFVKQGQLAAALAPLPASHNVFLTAVEQQWLVEGRTIFNEIVARNFEVARQRELYLQRVDLLKIHGRVNGIETINPLTISFPAAEHDFDTEFMGRLQSLKNNATFFRPFQFEALKSVLSLRENLAFFNIATGCGKTVLQIVLACIGFHSAKAGENIIIFTPLIELVNQFYEDFLKTNKQLCQYYPHLALPDENVIVKISSHQQSVPVATLLKNLTINHQKSILIFCTDSFDKLLTENPAFLRSSPLVLADEFDASCTTMNKLIENIEVLTDENEEAINIRVLGSTATLPKFNPLPEEIFTFTREQGVKAGILAPVLADCLGLNYSPENVQILIACLPQLFNVAAHPGFAHFTAFKNCRCVIWFSSIELCDQAYDVLNKKIPDFPIFPIHSKNPLHKRQLNNFMTNKDQPGLLIACNMIGIGFNDTELAVEILALNVNDDDHTSCNGIIQRLGRVMRTSKSDVNKIGYVLGFNNVINNVVKFHTNRKVNLPVSIDYLVQNIGFQINKQNECKVIDVDAIAAEEFKTAYPQIIICPEKVEFTPMVTVADEAVALMDYNTEDFQPHEMADFILSNYAILENEAWNLESKTEIQSFYEFRSQPKRPHRTTEPAAEDASVRKLLKGIM